MTKKDSFSAIDDFDIDESQNHRAIENGIYNAYQKIREDRKERILKSTALTMLAMLTFSIGTLFAVQHTFKQAKKPQEREIAQARWQEKSRQQTNQNSHRPVAECIKPGNVIDDDVNECVKGYRAKTW